MTRARNGRGRCRRAPVCRGTARDGLPWHRPCTCSHWNVRNVLRSVLPWARRIQRGCDGCTHVSSALDELADALDRQAGDSGDFALTHATSCVTDQLVTSGDSVGQVLVDRLDLPHYGPEVVLVVLPHV
jgi:hypothetical protein